MGKVFIIAGIVLIVLGVVSYVLPLFRLPGDIRFEGRQVRVYVPLCTSIVSIIITLLLNVFKK